MQNYLCKLFGKQNIKKIEAKNIILPLYLKSFIYEIFCLYGKNYVFVKAKDNIDIKQYNVQRKEIENRFGCEPVLIIQNSDYAKRKNLMSHGIMFIEMDKQFFVPTLGVVISNVRSSKDVEIPQKFTTQTQLVALYFLYEEKNNVVVKDIEKITSLNEMAISRALSILEKLNLIKYCLQGKKKIYNLNLTKSEYINKIIEYCSSPVSKIVLIRKDLAYNSCLSSYSALSEYTMLMEKDEYYAISKEKYKEIMNESEPFIDGFLYENNCVKCEVWKYDPTIFSVNGLVDRFSLFLSFDKENVDERTNEALNELIGELEYEI